MIHYNLSLKENSKMFKALQRILVLIDWTSIQIKTESHMGDILRLLVKHQKICKKIVKQNITTKTNLSLKVINLQKIVMQVRVKILTNFNQVLKKNT